MAGPFGRPPLAAALGRPPLATALGRRPLAAALWPPRPGQPNLTAMEPDARTTKLVTDLLALTLTENDTEAGAALSALRRRAARDAVTAGTLKQWLESLTGRPGLPPTAPELRQLHEIIETQRQELTAARQARSRGDTAMARVRHMEAILRDAEARASGRARAWILALGLGLGLGGGAGWLAGRSLPPPLATARAAKSPMTHAAWTRLTRFLDTCTLTSSNSLVGTQIRVHLLVAVNGSGRITHAEVAPDQANSFSTEEQRDYAEMMARTLDGGSCGRLPLPESLSGRAITLALYLPR